MFVTTIHSSSLSIQPAGYVKPERMAVQPQPSANPVNHQADDKTGVTTVKPSTPRQIQMAIEQSGLNNDNQFPQASNTRSAKALASYSQTRNQSSQSQLSNLISGIDLHA